VVDSNILVLGLAFKENCPDIRNTRVIDIIEELSHYHANVDVHDPWVDSAEALHEYGLNLITELKPNHYDAIILAVGHDQYVSMGAPAIRALGQEGSVLFDIKSILPKESVDARL